MKATPEYVFLVPSAQIGIVFVLDCDNQSYFKMFCDLLSFVLNLLFPI
jgi:hypothetical protein